MNFIKSIKSVGLAALLSTSLTISKPAKAEEMPFFEKCPLCESTTFSDYWTHGGQKIGWNGGADSRWSFSHNPINDGKGIEMRVAGPPSGGSYGAEAWVMTSQNFNDGNIWQINFSWQTKRTEIFSNRLQLQITDGYIDPNQGIYWECRDIPGTTNLLTDSDFGGLSNSKYDLFFDTNSVLSSDTLQNYSLEINPDGRARLFDGNDLQEKLLSERTLDKNCPWYFRVMAKDATSAGFPAGDYSMNVYDVSAAHVPEPSSFILLGMAGAGLGAYFLTRKK